jgi:drug/metabolite transporter (DMT)-like permease
MEKKSLKGNVILLTTAIIWGLAFVAQRVGGELMGAFAFNSIRFTLGGVSLLPLLIIFHRKGSKQPLYESVKEVLPNGIFAGSVLFIAASLQQVGIIYTTVGNTAFITGLYIILVPLFGIFLKHKITRQTWISGLIAVIGLYFLTIKQGFSVNSGDYFQLAGAFFWAIHILSIDYFVKKYDAIKIATIQFFTCAALSGIVSIVFEETTLQMIYDARWPIFYGGIMSVGVAYTLQVVGQKYAKPSHAAIILSLETVFGALGAAILLGEILSVQGYFGAVLMFAGMILSQVKFKFS